VRGRAGAALVACLVLAAACSGGGSGTERARDPSTTSGSATGATDAGDPGGATDGALRLGIVGATGLDPVSASPANPSATVAADLLFDGLTRLDEAGTPQPALADFAPNEDLTAWRFTLRDGTTFADGSPVEAADVVATLERVRALGGASLPAIALEDVVGVAALDARTVEVALAAPSALLPELLSAPVYGIIDREAPPGALGSPVNASGPYAVAESTAERVVLERRRDPGPDRVVLRFVRDEEAAADAVAAGELDWAPVPVERLSTLDADPAALPDLHATVLLGVNPNIEPLTRPGVRRAIALAIDRAAITAAVLGPAARPADGLVPAGVLGAPDACVDPCGADPAEADRLVREAFPGGAPPLQLLTDETALHDAIAGVLVEQLAAVGLDVTVAAVDEAVYAAAVGAGQTQLHLSSAIGLARSPAVHLLPWASTSPDNTTRYRNDLVDAAIAAAVAEPDPVVRIARWRQVEAAVLADVPVVPLAQLRTVAASRPRAAGLVVRADGSVDLAGVRAG